MSKPADGHFREELLPSRFAGMEMSPLMTGHSASVFMHQPNDHLELPQQTLPTSWRTVGAVVKADEEGDRGRPTVYQSVPLYPSQSRSKSVPLYPGQSHIIQVSPFVSKSVPISPSQSHHFRASSVVSQLVLLYTSQSHCVVVRLITYQSCPLCVTVPQCTSQSHRVPVSPIVSLSGSLCTRHVHCVSQSHSVPVSPIVYRSVLLCTSQSHCVLVRLIMYQSCPLCQSHRVPVSSIVYQPVPLGTSPALCVLTRPIMYQSCPLCITVPQGTSQSHCVPVPGFKVRVAQ